MRVIAIDGPAGSGKSTVARALASRLGLDYLDTGAMYRGVTFAVLPPDDRPRRGRAGGGGGAGPRRSRWSTRTVTVDGVDASLEIRGPEVTSAVSVVAANPGVRAELRRRQREWADEARRRGDRGPRHRSVVFPDAELKVYLTAAAGRAGAAAPQGGGRPRLRGDQGLDRRPRRPRLQRGPTAR